MESHNTVFALDDNSTIWGADAQEQWRALAAKSHVARQDGILVTSPKAVDYYLRHAEIASSNPEAAYFGANVALIPLQVDPPDHSRYRKMLDPLFSPRRMAAREEEVVRLTNELIDSFIERGSCDFAVEFAVPLPCAIFLRTLGLPLEDLPQFLKGKDDMIRPQGASTEEVDAVRDKASMWIAGYFNEHLELRSNGELTDDILGHLVGLERSGDLTRAETINICILQLMAGLDTVTDTLECNYQYLAQHPEHRQELVDDPSLIPAAVEELLRYETPVPTVTRIAMSDSEFDGCPMHKGDKLGVLLASVNHDEDLFPNADTVDFHRESNKHFAFGAGVHRCLGSHLARLELRVAMKEWHRRIPEYSLEEGHTLMFSPSLREIMHLPLVFPPGAKEG